jgi:ABC-2 type transport system ATP-binding protein
VNAVVIEARGLCFAYAGHAVLRGVDLQVDSGEIFGLVGADGAGKTTLMRILIGQLAPQQGELRVLGKPADSPALRAQTAYMPQGFGLYPDLSVRENLRFFAELHGLGAATAARRSADLLRRTGLEGFEARRAGALSGGMMQKLALACALLSEPRLMFLDEPTTGVDPLARRAFWNLLEGVRAEGVGIVYATANLEEAERCDRLGLLEKGSLQRQGSPLELAAIPGDAVLVRVSGGSARAQRAAVAALPGVERVFAMGQRLHVWLQGGAGIAAFRGALAIAVPGARAEPAAATLHDVTLRELALAHGAARAHAH